MATTVSYLIVVAIVITLLSPVTESFPFGLDNNHPIKKHRVWIRDVEVESSEVMTQTGAEEQETEEDSSEEVFGGFGSSSSTGFIPTNPPEPTGPVDPGQGGPDTGIPTQGPQEPETPAPTMGPQPTTIPPAQPLTTVTPPRGDVPNAFNPKQFDERTNPGRADPKPAPPTIDNNIAAISHDVKIKKPPVVRYPNRPRVPMGALVTVIVIGSLVVVLAVGAVAYFFATRVRIS